MYVCMYESSDARLVAVSKHVCMYICMHICINGYMTDARSIDAKLSVHIYAYMYV